MGEKWQVTVESWDTELDDWTQEVELVASREQLAGFAPGVVADALGAASVPEPLLLPNEFRGSLANVKPMFPVPGSEPADEPAPKRRRRTKAEIEADKLAEQTAAEVAVTNAGPDPYPVDTEGERQAMASVEVPFNPFAQ